jgi:hypothetical protein
MTLTCGVHGNFILNLRFFSIKTALMERIKKGEAIPMTGLESP